MNGDVAVFLITVVILPLLLTEFGDWCPWLATRLVRWAARHLGDPKSCERYEEEWIANLNEVPGKFARLAAAFGYLAYMPSLRRSIRHRLTRPPMPLAPRTLPQMPTSFTGRTREICLLLERLRTAAADSTQRRPILITGGPGVGKTALAIVCAHQLKDDFPDGQLFWSARSRSSTENCLNDLLMDLGVPLSQTPPSLAGKSALFRERIVGRRVLVVLDDVEPDLLPMLLGGDLPSPVLITSRRRPNDPSAVALALDGLTKHEAHELLRCRLGHRIDAEPEATAKLLETLNGLPLAILLAASVWARDPSATIASILASHTRLTDVYGEGAAVRAALDSSYQNLTAETRVLLRRLGLLPEAPFGKHEAALLMGTTPDHATRLIHALLDNRLIASAGEADRYVLHELIRAYARERLWHNDAADHVQELRNLLKRRSINPPSF